MFWLVERLNARGRDGDPVPSVGGVDPDDALFLVPVFAWLHWLVPLLVSAAIIAPLCAIALFVCFRSDLATDAAR